MSYAYAYRYRCIFPRGSTGIPYPNTVQWLASTFQDTDGVWKQNDKTGVYTGEILSGGVGTFNGSDNIVAYAGFNLEEDADFKVSFKIKFTGVTKNYETITSLDNKFILFANRLLSGNTPAAVITYNDNTQEIFTLPFNFLRDGTEYDCFFEKSGSTAVWSVDGTEYSTSLTKATKAISNGYVKISDDVDTSTFLNATVSEFAVDGFTKAYFEAGSGTTVFDVSGNSNHGTVLGTVVGFWGRDINTYSYLNRCGYNKSGSTYIPASLANLNVDVLGDPLEFKGKVKYNPILKSGTFISNGIDNYADTGYFAILKSVIILKGRFLSTAGLQSIGSVDNVNDRRHNFGINSTGNLIVAYGDSIGTNGSATTDLHTYITYNGSLWKLPYTQDTSTLALVKNILDNETPLIVSGGTWNGTAPSVVSYFLGAFNLGGIQRQRSNFQHMETQILEYDGVDMVLKHKWRYAEYDGSINYDVAGSNDITWGGTINDSNFNLSEYKRPVNLIDGCDVWVNNVSSNRLYIPFDVDGNSIKTNGDAVTGYTWSEKLNGTDIGHNGCETVYVQPVAPELLNVASNFTINPWYSGITPIDVSYSVISYDYETSGYWFADITSKTPIKFNWCVYNSAQIGDDLISIYLKMNTIEILQTSEGEDLEASDGKLYVYKEGIL